MDFCYLSILGVEAQFWFSFRLILRMLSINNELFNRSRNKLKQISKTYNIARLFLEEIFNFTERITQKIYCTKKL